MSLEPRFAVAVEVLSRALATRSDDRLWLATVAAPCGPPEALWRALGSEPAVLWSPPEGPALSGLGQALLVRGVGGTRFTQAGAAVESATRGWVSAGAPALLSPQPGLVGGAAFVPGGADEGLWLGFGDALWMLPRWTYRSLDGAATLTLATPPGPLAVAPLLAELEAIFAALEAPAPASVGGAARVTEEDTGRAWSGQVEEAREMIWQGRLAKVVLARRLGVVPAPGLDALSVLGRLTGEGPGLFRFGFRLPGRVFLGASPELLVARHGLDVRSVALAGSAARPDTGDEAELREAATNLLADSKQRDEHDLVVRWLESILTPLCETLDYPARPTLRELRRVLHLATPFAGRLTRPLAVLELASRLHPTPAVGGVPLDAAVAAIAELEQHQRGWFAGPFGYVAASGDGELAVALRSALLATNPDGEVTLAHVWAGAGILAASDPAAELEETRLKARTCLDALGVGA